MKKFGKKFAHNFVFNIIFSVGTKDRHQLVYQKADTEIEVCVQKGHHIVT